MVGNALKLSATFVNSSRPLSTVTFPESSYVISIAELASHYAAAASSPSNTIHILDKSDPRLIVRSLPGHTDGISYMRTARLFGGVRDVLLSCGADGLVKPWDERTGSVGVQMLSSARRTPLLCCDASPDGNLIAAGSVLQGEDAVIYYWDPRNPAAPLRRHTSTHSDDITAVHFSQQGSSVTLLSASSDGLLCISNPLEEDEDESTINVGNWGCSISKAGWLSPSSGFGRSSIWASSDMETLSLWSDELDRVKQVDREHLVQPNPALPWVTDYIIDCHNSHDASFHVFVGSNEGDISLLSPHPSEDQWTLEQLYTNGHSEIVRSILWDEDAGLLLSGGEDAKLNVWSSPVHFSQIEGNDHADMDVDLPEKRDFDDKEQNEQKRVRVE